jgi:hypothetical protein
MSGRKSQLEKFEARQAKARMDDAVIKQSEIEENKIEKRAGKIVKDVGLSTEDIFAIITRESVGTFVKMWNNSMESVIRETIRTEIRKIVQEELAGAYRGIVKGMTDVNSIVEEEMTDVVKDIVASQLEMNVKDEPVEEPKLKDRLHKKMSDKEIIQIIHSEGLDPTRGSTMVKTVGGRASTIYSKFMNEHKGENGAWAKYAQSFIENNE